ncbi:MAG: LytTR family transcriptional regulator [Rhizobiales bacterium]|nr:LytTR family transcriptional regulator [Hyphomicrobiales bacterium]
MKFEGNKSVVSEIIRLTTRATVNSLRGYTFWVVISGVTVVCFLSGPFGTFEALPNGFRLIYWALIVFTTGLVSLWTHALIRTQQWTALSRIAFVSALFGLIVVGLVILLSLSLLPPIQKYPGHIKLFAYSFPSATIIFMFSVLFSRSDTELADMLENVRPDLFNRLEKHPEARKILSLSAQDHYVEVTTEMGAELCLIRLNDAIAEAAPEEGFQIHRSHWVAKSAVEKLETNGSSGQVLLVDGRILNVSQSRLIEFKAFLG